MKRRHAYKKFKLVSVCFQNLSSIRTDLKDDGFKYLLVEITIV
jgi:hypothetical protein